MNIGIFYGSTTGNTTNAARAIKNELDCVGEVVLNEISGSNPSAMMDYDLIILGASTWGLGEMQDDWIGKENLQGVNLEGKKVAVFGTGDQMGFADTFVDAIGILAKAAEQAGANLIGKWSTAGYAFSNSAAAVNGQFLGLALDDDNEAAMTDERIKQWTSQLISEIK